MTNLAHRILGALQLVALVGVPLWVLALSYSRHWNRPTLPLVLLLCLAVQLLLIQYVSRHDEDLRRLLRSGLAFRLMMTAAFIVVLFGFYGGGDAFRYHEEGAMHADLFWGFSEQPPLLSYSGTPLVSRLVGLLYVALGPSFAAGMLAFSMLAFWGGYFFLRVYREAFPDCDLSTAGILLFFLPSPVFWTASLGKDALVFFCIGLFAFGFSRLSRDFRPQHLVPLIVGLAGIARIRPHIAAMLALAATTAVILGLGLPRLPKRVSQIVGLLVLVAGLSLLVPIVQQYLSLEELSLASTREFLEWQLRVTTKGGSAIALSESLPVRLATAPLTLVRPFPWEVHNLTSLLASAESILLVFLLVRYRRNILASLRAAQGNLTLLFAALFTVEFLFAFSSIANFGILARHRVALIPFLISFFILPARGPIAADRRPTLAGREDDARWRWLPDGRAG